MPKKESQTALRASKPRLEAVHIKITLHISLCRCGVGPPAQSHSSNIDVMRASCSVFQWMHDVSTLRNLCVYAHFRTIRRDLFVLADRPRESGDDLYVRLNPFISTKRSAVWLEQYNRYIKFTCAHKLTEASLIEHTKPEEQNERNEKTANTNTHGQNYEQALKHTVSVLSTRLLPAWNCSKVTCQSHAVLHNCVYIDYPIFWKLVYI